MATWVVIEVWLGPAASEDSYQQLQQGWTTRNILCKLWDQAGLMFLVLATVRLGLRL